MSILSSVFARGLVGGVGGLGLVIFGSYSEYFRGFLRLLRLDFGAEGFD